MMAKKQIEDVIQHGIYGTPETKPDERKVFLNTLRERVDIVLTLSQVKSRKVYPAVDKKMKHPENRRLLLNGQLDYSYLSRYIKLAGKSGMPFTIVHNENDSIMGLIISADDAIEKADILIEDEYLNKDMK